MAVLVIADHDNASLKDNTHKTVTPEDATRYPEMVGDCDEPSDARQFAAEADEVDAEEAGYGYGV